MSKPSVKSSNPANDPIKTVYQGTCPKLSTRGVGDLSYELGTGEAGNGHIRISANASSGAYSNEWLPLARIRSVLSPKTGQPFSSMVLKDLFHRRSANNHGYLAAILKAEGVISLLPGKPVVLTLGDWGSLDQKIQSLPPTPNRKAKPKLKESIHPLIFHGFP